MDSSDSSYYSRQQLDELFLQMIAFFSGDPKRIQHFMKVHSFARIIGTKEGLDETSLFILEAAAYTHDIGIRPAEEKYGRCDGKLQEQEGPIVAQQLWERKMSMIFPLETRPYRHRTASMRPSVT